MKYFFKLDKRQLITNELPLKVFSNLKMIKPSSIPNEYYFGDKPGTLQYAKDPDELIALEMPENNEDCGYKLCEHNLENLRRVIPHTRKDSNCHILLLMRSEKDGEIWLKAAIQDRFTGTVALITSTNKKENLKRPI